MTIDVHNVKLYCLYFAFYIELGVQVVVTEVNSERSA